MYINLDDAKQHLNINKEFREDDYYIASLCDVAEKVVEKAIEKMR